MSLRRREMIEQANLALALAELGDYDEALQNMLSVRALCRELGDVASAADSRVGLGKILRGRGNLDEAIDSFRRGHEACAAVGRNEYAAIALFELGRALEIHPRFPKRTNVEFVTVLSRSEIRVRFWERGAGYTQSSGTGSATAANPSRSRRWRYV